MRKSLLFLALSLLNFSSLIWAKEDGNKMQELEARVATGDATAKLELAKALYLSPSGIDQYSRIAALMKEAAEAGLPEAMDWLGYLTLEGKGVPKDERAALELFRKAAEAGLPKGQLHYGLMLRQSKTIELNNEEGLKWIEKAAEQGLIEAHAALGRIYFSGDRLQRRDPVRSYPYLKTAAEAGDPVSQNAMGVICRRGVGVPNRYRDPAQAEVWFRKAAEQGYAKAQANLAVELGLSPKSPRRREALMWLLASKNQNEILAIRTFEELESTFTKEEIQQAQEDLTALQVRNMILEAAQKGHSTLEVPQPTQ